MRPATSVLILLAAVALSAAIYLATHGRAFVFILPLVLALPFTWSRRR